MLTARGDHFRPIPCHLAKESRPGVLKLLKSQSRLLRRSRPQREILASALSDFTSRALQSTPGFAVGSTVNSAVYILGAFVLQKGLTPWGIAHSWVLGTTVYSAFGWRGYLLVCLYFAVCSAATQLKIKQKEADGVAEPRSGRRSIGSVWGSGLAGLICALAALTTQHHGLWQVGFVASFVSKAADTVSSEIGKAYRGGAFLITTRQSVPQGTPGAISTRGTLAGIFAAVAFAALAVLLGLVSPGQGLLVVAAALVANAAESLLGALRQSSRKFAWLNGNVQNILQISLSAYLAMLLVDF